MCVSGLASPANLKPLGLGPAPHSRGCGRPHGEAAQPGGWETPACSPSTQNKGAKGTHLSGHPPGSLTLRPAHRTGTREGGPASPAVATLPPTSHPKGASPRALLHGPRSPRAHGQPASTRSSHLPSSLPGTAGPGGACPPPPPWRGSAASSQHAPLLLAQGQPSEPGHSPTAGDSPWGC